MPGCSKPPKGVPRLRGWVGGEDRLSSGPVAVELAGAHGVAPGDIVVLLLLPTLLLLLLLFISRGLGGASNSLSRLLADT